MTAPRKPEDRLIAVIDIGSNSVRLVVYRGLKRTPDIVFNERVLCGLGAGIQSDGRMTDFAMKRAMETLERFSVLCRDMKVDEVDAIATAAARDAKNGPDFVRQIEKRCGFKVNVLAGKAEARLSAYGVLSGFPGADGLVGDLGGGSLELIFVSRGEMQEKVSLPIGPVRLLDEKTEATDEHIKMVKEAVTGVNWLERYRGRPFYIVGGAWRALAHLHIVQTGWPLHVLHGYEMGGEVAYNFAKVIEKQSIDSLQGVDYISRRRLVTLPLSARILREVIRITDPQTVITSAYGIREGQMFKKINRAVRDQDPLVTYCEEVGLRTARFKKHGRVLADWLAPIFEKEKKNARRLRKAVCHLSETSLKAHPDFKAELAYTRALVGRYVGVTHADRAMIAIALFVSYGGSLGSPKVRDGLQILNESQVDYATVLGLAVRLGQRLTGGTARPLKKTIIQRHKKKLVLEIRKKDEILFGDSVARRFNALSNQMGLEASLKIKKN